MGISQQIGSSSQIKPGVCTSLTRPASPYEGQMIYETDTDLVYLWSGSSWGAPSVTTASAGTNTTQLATTAFVQTGLGSWQDWTPTVTAGAGTITTSNLVMARYIKINKFVYFRFIYFITNRGTSTGYLYFTLPVASVALGAGGDSGIGTGREYQSTGYQLLVGQNSTTSCFISTYSAGTVLTNNYGISVVGMYEAAS